MKWFNFIFSVLFLFLIGCENGCVPPTQINVRYVDSSINVNHVTNSVVGLVRINLLGDTRPYCSGFFIQPHIIATAAHCLERPNLVDPLGDDLPGSVGQDVLFVTHEQWQTTPLTRNVPYFHANIMSISPENDVAILRTQFTSRDYLRINSRVPNVGDRIYSMSLPGGLPWVLTEGIISALEMDENNNLSKIMSSAGIYMGSSGCPLIDNHGNVIGVANSIGFRQATFSFFISARKLLLLDTTLRSI